MDEANILEVSREAILVMIQVSAPIMIIAMVVGLIISLFQAMTQIQEQTLAFVPKIVIVFVSLLVLFPYMQRTMASFMERLVDKIIALG